MENEAKKTEVLMSELATIHQRIADLEKNNTERNEIEKLIRQNEALQNAFVNAISLPAFMMHTDGTVISANEALALSLGKTLNDILGENIYKHLPSDVARRRKDKIDEVIQTKKSVHFSDKHIDRQYTNHILPVMDENGKITKIAVCFSEETERNLFDNKSNPSDFILNSAKELMTLINHEYIYEAVNDAYCKAHERSRDEIIGHTVQEIWGEDRFKEVIKDYIDECLTGKEIHSEDWFDFPGLGKGYFDVSYYPYRADNGRKVTHVAVITHDITEHKISSDAIKKSEKELKAQSHRLEELNASLKLLAKRREDDKKESETKILSNVRELVHPYLTRLKELELDVTQRTYVEIIENNLNEIVSPLLRTLSSQMMNFTPKEIQVASLIRDGKPTKEIAKVMGVSKGAIDIHRNHIRAKLGLNKKKSNLRSHLISLK